jgi:hypothetical protein
LEVIDTPLYQKQGIAPLFRVTTPGEEQAAWKTTLTMFVQDNLFIVAMMLKYHNSDLVADTLPALIYFFG